MKKKALFSWSTGKDSSIALHEVLKNGEYEIPAFLTTVTDEYDRVSMHGVRTSLLERQAESIGITLEQILIPRRCTNDIYEKLMFEVLQKYLSYGVETVIFGDIFLEDLRQYREEQLARVGMRAHFPIWNIDTEELSRMIIERGFRSKVVCVDGKCLEREHAGLEYDGDFISKLPDNVDSCGENGEFHTFTYEGPIFRKAVGVRTGGVEFRENRFYYCDLMPV